jgi:phage major head subunit gpT-like protein
MSQLTPSFTFDLERRMRVVSSREYERLNRNLYWSKLAKEMPSTGRAERLIWLLDSAKIEYVSRLGGEVTFDDILSNTTEFEAKAATAGLKLNRFQLEDHDGGGVQLAAHWARQMGAYAAYWPQKQVTQAIRVNGNTYDGQAFFSSSHPLNPFDSALGNYSNDFTGASSGIYPGAVPIDSSVTLDVALSNLGKAIAYVNSLKMPNGEDPRGLRVTGIMGPSALVPRMQQITNAKFIAQAATTGGGAADVEAVVRNWGLGEPIEAPELGSAFTAGAAGSDTTYYLIAEGITSDDVGALIYVNREPFSIVYNGEMNSDQLARVNELQWLTRGRNVVGYGHPYLLFRCKAA